MDSAGTTSALSKAARWGAQLFCSAVWFAAGIGLMVVAVFRFQSGLHTEAAFPAPIFLLTDSPLPQRAYKQTAQYLLQADHNDGISQAFAAEALAEAHALPSLVTSVAIRSVRDDPSSARTWCLVARGDFEQGKMGAGADALDLALILGPFDYWAIGCRVRVAARYWSALSPQARQEAQRQARLMWEEKELRPQIVWLIGTPGGSNLLTRALSSSPEEIRALNRWYASQTRDWLVRKHL